LDTLGRPQTLSTATAIGAFWVCDRDLNWARLLELLASQH
jgi:hypothetical protein